MRASYAGFGDVVAVGVGVGGGVGVIVFVGVGVGGGVGVIVFVGVGDGVTVCVGFGDTVGVGQGLGFLLTTSPVSVLVTEGSFPLADPPPELLQALKPSVATRLRDAKTDKMRDFKKNLHGKSEGLFLMPKVFYLVFM